VGKTVFIGHGLLCLSGAPPLAETTIVSVQSATQITVGTNASATLTGTASLVWGTVDNSAANPALQNAWNAMVALLENTAAMLQLPAGIILVEAGVGCNPAIDPVNAPTIAGFGPAATVLMATPNFVFNSTNTGGAPVCASKNVFFGGITEASTNAQIYFRDFCIHGCGVELDPGSSGWTILSLGPNSIALNVYVNAWCGYVGNINGIYMAGPCTAINVQGESAGGISVVFQTAGQPINAYWIYAGDNNQGAAVLGSGTLNSYGGTYNSDSADQGLSVSGNAIINSYGELLEGVYLNAACTLNVYGGTMGINNASSSQGVVLFGNSSAKLYLCGTTLTPQGTTGYAIAGTGSVFDMGGNELTAGASGTIASGILVFNDDSITGTAQTLGNVALTSGWGSGAAVGAVIGNTRLEQFTVTAGSSPGASPVLTITFPTPFWVTPVCTITQTGGTFGELSNPSISVTKTAATITFSGTPANGHTYTFVLTAGNS